MDTLGNARALTRSMQLLFEEWLVDVGHGVDTEFHEAQHCFPLDNSSVIVNNRCE